MTDFPCGWCSRPASVHSDEERVDCLLLVSAQLSEGIVPHGWGWATR